jgi:hypothetical protein
MTTRRDFLDLAMKNSVCTAAAALIPGGASASPVAGVNGFGTAAQETDSDSKVSTINLRSSSELAGFLSEMSFL